MAEPLAVQILRQLPQVAHLYYRLLLVVSPSGAGKTAALQEVTTQTGIRYINVNIELSRRLLELTQRQRKLFTPRLLEEIVGQDAAQTVLLDNLEVLFDPSLQAPSASLSPGARASSNGCRGVEWDADEWACHLRNARPCGIPTVSD